MAPGSRSVVYAVNTLHVARDLDFTLGEIRTALEPGGRLIVSECVRMQPGQPLNAEFIFNLMATFRSRRPDTPGQPPAGFLLPEQWKATLEAAGFTALRFLPDVRDVQRTLPRFTPPPSARHVRSTPRRGRLTSPPRDDRRGTSLTGSGQRQLGFAPRSIASTVCSRRRTRRDRIVSIRLIRSGVSSSTRQK